MSEVIWQQTYWPERNQNQQSQKGQISRSRWLFPQIWPSNQKTTICLLHFIVAVFRNVRILGSNTKIIYVPTATAFDKPRRNISLVFYSSANQRFHKFPRERLKHKHKHAHAHTHTHTRLGTLQGARKEPLIIDFWTYLLCLLLRLP